MSLGDGVALGLVFLVACGAPPTVSPTREPDRPVPVEVRPTAPAPVAAPRPVTSVAFAAGSGTAPPPTKLVAMFYAGVPYDDVAVSIDAAGVARRTDNVSSLGTTEHWIPFSEPVASVVYVQQVAQRGRIMCGLTRNATVECVLHGDAPTTASVDYRRLVLPFDGAVQQIGVHTVSPRAVCGTTDRGSTCWSFAPDGNAATALSLSSQVAQEVAAGLTPGTLAVWQTLAPTMSAQTIRKVVRTDATDSSNVVPDPPRDRLPEIIAAQCALLDDGQLTCHGSGAYAQLGDGSHAVDVRVSRPVGSATVVDVAMSGHHGCAVLADGHVACWGEISDLPRPKRHKLTALPMCSLDRKASSAAFEAARAADIQHARQCGLSCQTKRPGERDTCLGCVTQCMPLPYIFRRAQVCRQPSVESTLVQRGIACAEANQTSSWLSDAELRAQASPVELALSPVTLPGITDAVAVALPGYTRFCILRKSGQIACLGDYNKLVPIALRP